MLVSRKDTWNLMLRLSKTMHASSTSALCVFPTGDQKYGSTCRIISPTKISATVFYVDVVSNLDLTAWLSIYSAPDTTTRDICARYVGKVLVGPTYWHAMNVARIRILLDLGKVMLSGRCRKICQMHLCPNPLRMRAVTKI